MPVALVAGAVATGRGMALMAVAVSAVYGALVVGVDRAWGRAVKTILPWADGAFLVVSAAVIAGAGPGALPAAGVAVAVPLVVLGAYDDDADGAGRASVTLAGAAAAAAGVALVRGHPLAGLSVLAVVVTGLWLVAAAPIAAERASAGERREAELDHFRHDVVTTVSHELRTPLTIIQGTMSTLSRRWDVLSERQRLDLVDVLIDNVASLDSSILHFADAARLERGGFVIEPSWVDLAATLHQVEAKLSGILSGHDVQRELKVTNVWADPGALATMLEHLLVNAARFSPMGSPIRVQAQVSAGEAVVTVVDRGQGIPPHLQRVVWVPLERGDVTETGVSRGAGLGLPIVRELARLHGGDADLASIKGRGTSVWIRLPQPAGEPGEPGPQSPEGEYQAHAPDSGSRLGLARPR